jgi:hypothetical protein
MPMTLNVGASQKVADDHYGSRGASVNLEIELDSGLVMDSARLQDRIRQLFGLVRQSLAEELNGNGNSNGHGQPPRTSSKAAPSSQPPDGRRTYGNGRLATAKQVKALYAIARERGFDLRKELRDRYNLDRPEQFTIQQASELIDTLRSNNE